MVKVIKVENFFKMKNIYFKILFLFVVMVIDYFGCL